jgi:glycosyltransferase involved in cell wall biosynthesis
LIFKVLRLSREIKADYIFFDQPWLGWLMPFIKLLSRAKIYLRSNNIEYLRFKSMGKSWWTLLYMYEKLVYRMADLVIFVSDVDQRKAIDEFNVKAPKTFLAPYGIEPRDRPDPAPGARKFLEQTYGIGDNEKILLFFATLSYRPNYEAVAYIAEEVYPRLKNHGAPFKILICGKNLPEDIRQKLEGKPEMVYCGFVDDINSYIDGCDVMINPILSGGGVKTKAIDTLARSGTVISTRTGAEGIEAAVCGRNLVVVEDGNWAAFAEAIIAHKSKSVIPGDFYSFYHWPYIINRLSQRLASL